MKLPGRTEEEGGSFEISSNSLDMDVHLSHSLPSAYHPVSAYLSLSFCLSPPTLSFLYRTRSLNRRLMGYWSSQGLRFSAQLFHSVVPCLWVTKDHCNWLRGATVLFCFSKWTFFYLFILYLGDLDKTLHSTTVTIATHHSIFDYAHTGKTPLPIIGNSEVKI